ncbi:MAG: hypothetical protein HC769_35300 [Cyanobacteria bacterium CRU_2_1]|nr:hypothetical protein [Cyanobacteria bacterium CRU_2_1]
MDWRFWILDFGLSKLCFYEDINAMSTGDRPLPILRELRELLKVPQHWEI